MAGDNSGKDSPRHDEIQLVMKEKEAMVRAGKELLELAKSYPEKIDELAFGNKALEFIQHLSNMGGFCDNKTKAAIFAVVRDFTAMVIQPNRLEIFTATKVRLLVPMAIGIQVDFTKRPFRVFGLDLKAFGGQVRATVKR